MKFLIISLFLLTTEAFSQPRSKAFEDWNRAEQLARQREEEVRLKNEERARGLGPEMQKEEEQIECKCPPSNSQTPDQP